MDRTISFNSVTLKSTQTEPQKYIIFFNETNDIKSRRIEYKNNFRNYFFLSTLSKITVGGFVNLQKKFWPYNCRKYTNKKYVQIV